MGLPDNLAAESFCYLSTRGRVTGRTHTIEIWFAGFGPDLYLLADSPRSDWVRNLVVESRVSVRIADRVWAGTAAVVSEAERRVRAAELVHAKYAPGYGGDLTRWRDTALPVAVTLPADGD